MIIGMYMGTKYSTESHNYVESMEFQEYVVEKLKKYGYIITLIKDEKDQYLIGESVEGYEIKNDKRFSNTGNLFIEICEKSNPNQKDWTASGIYRNDNTHTYIIGDKDKVFIFNKKHLKELVKNLSVKDTSTSQGKLLSIKELKNKDCIIINFKDEEVIDPFWFE